MAVVTILEFHCKKFRYPRLETDTKTLSCFLKVAINVTKTNGGRDGFGISLKK